MSGEDRDAPVTRDGSKFTIPTGDERGSPNPEDTNVSGGTHDPPNAGFLIVARTWSSTMGFSRRSNGANTNYKARFRGRDAALAAALAAAGLVVMPGTLLAAGPTTPTDSENVNDEVRYARQLSRAFRSVAAGVAPSVVSIEVTDSAPYHGSAAPGSDPYPNGRGAMPLPPRRGGATGVVIDKKGYIVTNYHVVEGADEILVEFHDGTRVDGTLVGSDRDTDLAVIQVKSDDLTPARLGDSRTSEVGEWILAVGSPFGLDQTVTAGIISAVGRDQMGLAQYESFIQTDAAINPGNSGGPLVNLDGEVIGINTAIRTSSGGSNGIGFAIPTSIVERVSSSIIDSGRVERGWLGVAVQPLSDELALSFGYEGEDAVLVSNVLPNTPAADAGLLAGDIITMIGGEMTGDPAELIRAVGQHDADTEVPIEYVREGQQMMVVASLIERPANMEDFIRGRRGEVGQIGLIVKPLGAKEAESLGIATGKGIYVEAVEKGSPADEAGLLPGDVIRRINGEKLQDPIDFSNAIRTSISAKEAIRVLVERADLTYFILIDPETD